MITVTVKKIHNGKASLRDYIVEQAIRNDQSILVSFKGKTMLLSPDELKEGVLDPYIHVGDFPPYKYHLIDFPWQEQKIVTRWVYEGTTARLERVSLDPVQTEAIL